MRRTFEVWFYIGILLSLYGILLTAAGAYQWVYPPATVLAEKHATFWAGAILLIVGGVYTLRFWPRLTSNKPHDDSQAE